MKKSVVAALFVVALVAAPGAWAQEGAKIVSLSEAFPIYETVPATAPRNVAALHPAFILSPRRVDAARKRGRELSRAGKTTQDLRKMFSQLPRGVRGERGRSHESSVACWSFDAFPILWQSFYAASRYESFSPPVSVLQNGMYLDQLSFQVSLVSVPRNQEASDADVVVKKFVVTDDQGNIIEPVNPLVSAVANSGTMTLTGTTPVTTTSAAQTTIDTTTYSTDADGNKTKHETSGVANTVSYQTEYRPWSQDYPYYYAGYEVRFPLFKPDGQPYITRQTKKLTLHIITEAGERIAEYKLEMPKE